MVDALLARAHLRCSPTHPDHTEAALSLALWFRPSIIAEYVHGAAVRVHRATRGHTRHPGEAGDIIDACIDACWNGRTYTASPGHFDTFWTRDLSFSAPALVRLSPAHRERVRASLEYAIDVWERRGSHITTTIHYFDSPSDVFDYGVDSLPLLLAALRAVGDPELVARHRAWLQTEVDHFADVVVDPATGLVRSDRTFSAHRDTVTNRSNAYGNSMVALLAKTLTETGWLSSPLERHFRGDYGRLLMGHFWGGDRFIDALGEDWTSGEANIWPFWVGVIDDPVVLERALATLSREGYCDPYPLRYETERHREREVWVTRYLLPDYQGSTVWTSLGAMYLQLLRHVDPVRAGVQTRRYAALVERDGTFWEVLATSGECWVSASWVMIGEESMLWSAIFLDHLRNPEALPALLSPWRLPARIELGVAELDAVA
jgi:hypothetical protein